MHVGCNASPAESRSETFAPVAKLASLRTVLALAAELDLEVHQMDVKSAYLNGELKEDIYMKPPPEFEVPDGMVLKLDLQQFSDLAHRPPTRPAQHDKVSDHI